MQHERPAAKGFAQELAGPDRSDRPQTAQLHRQGGFPLPHGADPLCGIETYDICG